MGRIQWPLATQLMFLIGIGLLIAALVGLATLPTREPAYRTARATISVDLLDTLQADIGRRMRQPIETREDPDQPLSQLLLPAALIGLGLFSWWALGAPRRGQLGRWGRPATALGVLIAIPVLIILLMLVVLNLVPGRGQAPPDATTAATDGPGATSIALLQTATADAAKATETAAIGAASAQRTSLALTMTSLAGTATQVAQAYATDSAATQTAAIAVNSTALAATMVVINQAAQQTEIAVLAQQQTAQAVQIALTQTALAIPTDEPSPTITALATDTPSPTTAAITDTPATPDQRTPVGAPTDTPAAQLTDTPLPPSETPMPPTDTPPPTLTPITLPTLIAPQTVVIATFDAMGASVLQAGGGLEFRSVATLGVIAADLGRGSCIVGQVRKADGSAFTSFQIAITGDRGTFLVGSNNQSGTYQACGLSAGIWRIAIRQANRQVVPDIDQRAHEVRVRLTGTPSEAAFVNFTAVLFSDATPSEGTATPPPSATPQIGQRGARIEATWPERLEVGRAETLQMLVVFVTDQSTPTPSPPASTAGPVRTVVVQISPSELAQPTPLPGQPATTYQPCISARLVGPRSLTLGSTDMVCQPITGEWLSWSWDVRADAEGVYDLTSVVEIIWVARDADVAPVARTLWERSIRLVASHYLIPTNQLGPLSLANAVVGTLLTIPATRRRLRGAAPPGPSSDELLKSLLADQERAARAAQPAHLNTRFDGIGERDPLPVGQRVPLIIWVGPQIDTSSAQSSRPFTYAFREHDTVVDFTVHVQGDPEQWTIKPIEPTMRVTSAGETLQDAEFMVIARRPGADKLYIHVERTADRMSVQHVWLPVIAGEQARALGTSEAPQAAPQAARAVRMPLGPGGIRRRAVELSVYSRRAGSQFEMLVKADLPERRIFQFFEMPVSVEEIQNATIRLRQELQRIVLYPVEQAGETSYPFADLTALSVDPAVARAATVALADAGQQVWQLLFRAPRADAELRQIGELIRGLPEGGQIQIVIESQQFIIPWALLYDKPGPITAETLDWSGFWGYRYVIDILPPGNYPEPVIRGEPSINLLLSKDPDLIPFATAQRDYLRDTLHIHPSEAWGTRDVLQRLASLDPSTVLYVYCHGVHESGAVRPGALASESALSFSAGERIRIADMRRLPGGALPDHALVFLNACEGATQQAFYYDGFMPFFIEECGACGFIGTEVKTPVLLAHDLAQHFMRLFVQGGSVGQILWRLRRHYLKNHHTILGFNYTLYGLDELKLARPTRADQQRR